MREKKPDAGTEKAPKSDLDLLEEALVGTHQDPAGVHDNAHPEDDGRPPVPGHRSP